MLSVGGSACPAATHSAGPRRARPGPARAAPKRGQMAEGGGHRRHTAGGRGSAPAPGSPARLPGPRPARPAPPSSAAQTAAAPPCSWPHCCHAGRCPHCGAPAPPAWGGGGQGVLILPSNSTKYTAALASLRSIPRAQQIEPRRGTFPRFESLRRLTSSTRLSTQRSRRWSGGPGAALRSSAS